MKRMSDVQKIVTAQLLVRVIDADAKDDDLEIKLFNVICRETGVDVLVNAKSWVEQDKPIYYYIMYYHAAKLLLATDHFFVSVVMGLQG